MIESVLLFSISTLKVILYSSYSLFGTDNFLKNALLLNFPPGSSVADISKLAVQGIDSILLLTFNLQNLSCRSECFYKQVYVNIASRKPA